MRLRLAVRGLVCAATIAACSERKQESDPPQSAPLDQPDGAALSAGEVSITTKGGALVMALRHDSVLVAFSDSIRQSVRAEISTDEK